MKSSNIPAIFIWILYGLTASCCLFLAAMSICLNQGIPTEIGLAVGAGVLIVLGFVVRGIGKKAYIKSGTMLGVIIESLLMVGMLVGMVLYRVWLPLESAYWQIAGDPMYELAKVNVLDDFPQFAHRGAETYFYLLHGVMIFLGNRPESAMVLQLVLLVIAALCVYFGVRKGAGCVAALCSVAFLGFAPFFVVETCKLTPFLLVVIFYSLAIGSSFSLPERLQGGKIALVAQCLWTGFLIGCCCYLDMAGITLLVFLTGSVCLFQKDEDENEENEQENSVVFSFLGCVVTAVFVYGFCHFMRSFFATEAFASMNEQLMLYMPTEFSLPITVDLGVPLWDIPILALLMSVGIFSFWISRKVKLKAVWLFTAGLLFFMQCMHMNETECFNAYALLFLLCVAMAGVSVAELFGEKYVPSVTEAIEDEQESEPESVHEMENETVSGKENETIPAQSQPEDVEQKPEIHYIENPLPLPKKKERKVLDYDYEVADDDDFDIP